MNHSTPNAPLPTPETVALPQPLRVLLVEDSELDAGLLLRELERAGFAPDWQRVANAADLQAALAGEPWEVVLSDYSMPGFTGFDALEIVKASGQDLPFILISGTVGEETAVSAMKAGAHDYLLKDQLARLGGAVKRELRDAEVRRARHRAEAATRAAEAATRHQLKLVEAARNTLLRVVEDHQRTEASLWAERNLLRTLVDHLPVCVYVKDKAARKTLVNAMEARFLGVATEAKAVGTTDDAFYPPEQVEAMAAIDRRILDSGQPELDREEFLTRPSGATAWVLSSKVPLRDANGKVTGLLGISVDITARKVAEATMRRRLACEHAAADCMSLMVQTTDPEECFPRVLAILRTAVGISRSYIFRNEGSPEAGWCMTYSCEDVAEGIAPQLPNPRLQRAPYAEVAPSLLPVLQARQPFARLVQELSDPERALLTAQGVQSVLVLPIFCGTRFSGFIGFDDYESARRWDPDDIKLLQVVADGIGVTLHRQEAEAQLRLQSSALEAAANAIVITDRNGVIQWANPAFTTFTGYTQAEAVGRPTGELLRSGKHDDAFYRAMWDTILAGQIWQGEVINRRKDGSLYTEELTITPLKNQSGGITHFIAVKQDVTQRKALEEQFRQSHKMEAIGQLAGGVAHDFNNMLAVIMGNASLVQMGLSPEDQQHALQEISRAGERASNLTRQLLTFSRRQVLQARPLDLNDIVSGMVKMLHRIIGEDITLQTKLLADGAPIHADPGMIEQVLLNLSVNARDAMLNGGELAISLARVHYEPSASLLPPIQPGDYIRLSVRDTGSGIAPEHLPKIFDPFYTTKDVGKGTGLGLATVHGIVKQHQGWVKVDTHPGTGTTFHVYLPRLADARQLQTADQEATHVRGGSEMILLVEDEAAVRTLTARVLKRYGYRVLEAANGLEAISIWQNQHGSVDLLLTDIIMPEGLSGRQLADQLRATHPALKIIFTSGYPGEVAGRGLELREGVNFLKKPFAPLSLAKTVRECLDAVPEAVTR